MTKEEIKNKLDELISELDYALADYTFDANALIDVRDWYDLMYRCSKAKHIWEQICDLADYWEDDDYYQDERKELDSIIDEYESQIKQFKEACEEAKKGE